MSHVEGTDCTVAWDGPGELWLAELRLPQGATVAAALEAAADCYRAQFPGRPLPDWSYSVIGVWGRRVERHAALCEGDRVEIYRPLRGDPRVRRRQRVAQQRTESGTRSGRRP